MKTLLLLSLISFNTWASAVPFGAYCKNISGNAECHLTNTTRYDGFCFVKVYASTKIGAILKKSAGDYLYRGQELVTVVEAIRPDIDPIIDVRIYSECQGDK